jgi:LmbE family N-acetylglucosaminyl deacetylase
MLSKGPVVTILVLMAVTCLIRASRAQTGLDLVDVDFLYIGAHPDDELHANATMARYVLDQGFRGALITFTRGEGGGNVTGPETGPALGLIRTEELRRSLETIGIDTFYFTGQNDFYFTQFAEETQERWGDQFICDVARIVRLTRPEVIITMWPGPGTHGHHQLAARASTIIFDRANDPDFCPEQLSEEFINLWQPLKLYYADFFPDQPGLVQIPTDDWSPSANMRYYDLKVLSLSHQRSQAGDLAQLFPPGVENPGPERFLLAKSIVPIAEPETHLLAGAVINAGNSPPGVLLQILPESYKVVAGTFLVTVTLTNRTDVTIEGVQLGLEAPEPLAVEPQGDDTSPTLMPGASTEATFNVRVPDASNVVGQYPLRATYNAEMEGLAISGQNRADIEVSGPVEVVFQPLFDIVNYQLFALETGTESVIPRLTTQLPLTVGAVNVVTIDITNLSDQAAAGELAFDLPEGLSVGGDLSFQVPANQMVKKTVNLTVEAAAVPEGRHSAALSGTVSISGSDAASSNPANLFALPTLSIPRVAEAPTIDGDLSDMQSLPVHDISHLDLWSGAAEGPEDTGGQFHVGYDDTHLYIGVRVTDQNVVCNIEPDNIRAHWRSDSVEVTIDPSGQSQNTSTTFKSGIFPCTTENFEARAERDADANQGVIEETAPGMEVASQPTANGYIIEIKIPWGDMPSQPVPGSTIGFNVLIYDGDQADASPGANIGESRAGWASVSGAQQAIPYVWPKVMLEQATPSL